MTFGGMHHANQWYDYTKITLSAPTLSSLHDILSVVIAEGCWVLRDCQLPERH